VKEADMPETTAQQILRLKKNLMVTLRAAEERLGDAKRDAERGHSFSVNTGPHAVLDLLLSAQSLSTRINMLEN
jgi:hypothetical protein